MLSNKGSVDVGVISTMPSVSAGLDFHAKDTCGDYRFPLQNISID